MKNQELNKKLDELFEELRNANKTIPIIVEGKNDEVALRKLGISGKIFKLNTGSSILNFCHYRIRICFGLFYKIWRNSNFEFQNARYSF